MASPNVDVIIRIGVVVSIPLGGFAVYQNQELTHCVASYNNANNQRSKALTEATDAERNAERKADDAQAALFLSPVLSKPSADRSQVEQAEVLRLFRAYQDALSDQRKERADADDARRDHPIPDPPSQVCG
jgi:hypothetical protein